MAREAGYSGLHLEYATAQRFARGYQAQRVVGRAMPAPQGRYSGKLTTVESICSAVLCASFSCAERPMLFGCASNR